MIVFGLARDRVLVMVCAAFTVVAALGGPPMNALATAAANVHVQGQVMVCLTGCLCMHSVPGLSLLALVLVR